MLDLRPRHTGKHRDLGTEIDVVLALEEWERLEFEFIASAFRAERAFGEEEGTWSYRGFLAMRIAFLVPGAKRITQVPHRVAVALPQARRQLKPQGEC
jgi:hypothetical protein